MSEETSPVFFVRFSNNRRKFIELQNKKFIVRKNNFMEFYSFNFFPIVITSTILAPFNRLKILQQISNFIPNKDISPDKGEPKGNSIKLSYFISSNYLFLIVEINKETKWKGFWRGNQFLNYKIFLQTSMKYFFFDRLKYKQTESNKFYKNYYFIQIFNNIMISLTSSFIALVFTYPIDLAYTRKTGKLIPDGNYENYRSCFHTKIDTMIYYDIPLNKMLENQKNKNQILFSKYYEGFSYALLLSTVSCFFNMIGFSIIHQKISSKDEKYNNSINYYISLLGYTSFLTILTSPFVYPFDTLLRHVQVNGGRGYANRNEMKLDGLKNLVKMKNLGNFYK